jgi:hypothetical protein
MRTFIALFCLVLVLALASVASAAPADQVDVKRVTQSPAAVADYWTAERMENAIPVQQVRDAASGRVEQAAAPFESYEYPGSYTVFPASTHGKVFFTMGGSNFVCSGTALTSTNRSVVWTAGHCVNEGPGAFATNWAFVPAYRDGSRPFGTWTARALVTSSQWGNQGDISYDVGAAVMNTNGSALTDVVGGRAIAFNYNRSQFYTSFGYPAAPPFNGERLWVCESNLLTSDSSTSPQTMGIGCDMTGGSSGGGWIVGGAVHSVNSYGYLTQPNVMYGPYQGSVAQGVYNDASAR